MGRLATTRFAQEGARVVACDVDLDAARQSVAMAEAAGGRALAVRADAVRATLETQARDISPTNTAGAI